MILQIGHANFIHKNTTLGSAIILPGINELSIIDNSQVKDIELVIIIQNTPDEYSAADLQQLLRAFPLSRLVVIYGPWCEGDNRNRQVWPHSLRVPWYMAECYLQQLRQQKDTQIPLTTSREELFRLLYSPDSKINNDVDSECLNIISCDYAYGMGLKDALGDYFPYVKFRLPEHKLMIPTVPTKFIYDLDDAPSTNSLYLQFFSQLIHNQILLLTGFPHAMYQASFPVFSKLTPVHVIAKFFHSN